jgi:Tfp pilus assembly protein PilN
MSNTLPSESSTVDRITKSRNPNTKLMTKKTAGTLLSGILVVLFVVAIGQSFLQSREPQITAEAVLEKTQIEIKSQEVNIQKAEKAKQIAELKKQSLELELQAQTLAYESD